MLSQVVNLKPKSKGGEAQREYLKQTEYYKSEDLEVGGGSKYFGSGAEALGLDRQNTPDLEWQKFDLLCEGRHPETGKSLVRGAGDGHRAGFDMTATQSKSASVLQDILMTYDPEAAKRLAAVEEKAVRKLVEYIENRGLCIARVGAGGTETVKVKPVVAGFYHDETRAGESGKHRHLIFLNVGQAEDGRWLCLENKPFLESHLELGAVYRMAYDQGLRELGYATELREINAGKPEDGYVSEIVGVPKDLIEANSSRGRELREWASKNNVSIETRQGKQEAALKSRKGKAKDESISRPVLVENAKARAEALGLYKETIKGVAEAARAHPGRITNPGKMDLSEACDRIETRMIDGGGARLNESVLRFQALNEAQKAGKSLDEALKVADRFAEENFIKGNTNSNGSTWYASTVVVGMEREALDFARATKGDKTFEISARARAFGLDIFKSKTGVDLRAPGQEESLAAFNELCDTGGSRLVVGFGGTGKTFVVEAYNCALEAEVLVEDRKTKRNIYGTAVSAIAASGLDGAVDSQKNLALLTMELQQGKISLGKGDVLLIDEAGMASSLAFAELSRQAKAAGACLRIIGDPEQLQAIGLPSLVEEYQKISGAAELKKVRRQEKDQDKATGLKIRAGAGAEALATMRENGQWRVAGNENRDVAKAAAKWFLEEQRDKPLTEKRIGASSKAVVREINLAIQDQRRKLGQLGQGEVLKDYEGLESSLSAGDRFAFKRNTKKADLLEVFHDGKWQKAASNRKAPVSSVSNGQFGTVESIEKTEDGNAFYVSVKLDQKGQEATLVRFRSDKYSDWAVGYSSTLHSAQGITQDAYCLALTGSAAENKFLAYVGATRHRHDVAIITSTTADEKATEIFTRGEKTQALEADLKSWASTAREGNQEALAKLRQSVKAGEAREQKCIEKCLGLKATLREAREQTKEKTMLREEAAKVGDKKTLGELRREVKASQKKEQELAKALDGAEKSLFYARAGAGALMGELATATKAQEQRQKLAEAKEVELAKEKTIAEKLALKPLPKPATPRPEKTLEEVLAGLRGPLKPLPPKPAQEVKPKAEPAPEKAGIWSRLTQGAVQGVKVVGAFLGAKENEIDLKPVEPEQQPPDTRIILERQEAVFAAKPKPVPEPAKDPSIAIDLATLALFKEIDAKPKAKSQIPPEERERLETVKAWEAGRQDRDAKEKEWYKNNAEDIQRRHELREKIGCLDGHDPQWRIGGLSRENGTIVIAPQKGFEKAIAYTAEEIAEMRGQTVAEVVALATAARERDIKQRPTQKQKWQQTLGNDRTR